MRWDNDDVLAREFERSLPPKPDVKPAQLGQIFLRWSNEKHLLSLALEISKPYSWLQAHQGAQDGAACQGVAMTTKLHINISQGVIDVEGDPDLVRGIYDDFKDQLLDVVKRGPTASAALTPGPTHAENGDSASDASSKPKPKRRTPPKKKVNGDDSASGVVADSPKLDKNLDTSGLGTFYGKYVPKNNAEKNIDLLEVYG